MQKQEEASYARQQGTLLSATARMRGAELLLALFGVSIRAEMKIQLRAGSLRT
jgi:hypothetical protein